MRHLSAIILIVLLSALSSCKYFKSNGLFGRKVKNEAVLKARQDSTRVADSFKLVEEQYRNAQDERLVLAQKTNEEKLSVENSYRYNIIIGSFLTAEYAKQFAEIQKNNGYDAQIIKTDESKYELVSAEAYESLEKALSRLKVIQASIEPQAWIYIKK